ncbi:MAG TPA: SpoIIE family protein phosphatase [Blastococcus sp.]
MAGARATGAAAPFRLGRDRPGGRNLHTDGLVERRGSTLDEGIAALACRLWDLTGTPLEELCDGLLRGMLRGTPQDDVALVAVRIADTCAPAGAGTAAAHG